MFENEEGLVMAAEPDAAPAIESRLLASLAERLPQAVNEAITYTVRDGDGSLVGGVVGSTSYGWLLVKVLWVAEARRGSGIGRRLLAAAEGWAVDVGCHGVWLDTSNPDTIAFYGRLGYEPFGELANRPDQTPPDHHRWFLHKMLPGSAPA